MSSTAPVVRPVPATAALARRSAFLAGAATFAFYCIGATRPLDYDGSTTVGLFVVTSSLLDPLRRQYLYNNQVLLSFVDHMLYSLTGSSAEFLMRLVPMLAAAAAVGVVVFEVGRRLGAPAGLAAGVLLATHPMMVVYGRQVRAYSLLVFFAVLATALLLRGLEGPPSRRLIVGYVVCVAAGLLSHLYMAGVIAVHVAIVGRRGFKVWAPRWAAGIAAGLAPMVVVLAKTFEHRPLHAFRQTFPARLVSDLLGGRPATIALTAAMLVVAVASLWRVGWIRRATAMAALVVLVVWLGAPRELFTRFFVWLVPAVAAGVAVAVARSRLAVAVVVGVAGFQLAALVPHMGRAEVANRAAARIVGAVEARGATACTLGLSDEPLLGYTRLFTALRHVDSEADRRRLQRCAVAVQVAGVRPEDQPLVDAASALFPYSAALPAQTPGRVFSVRPIECWTRPAARC